MYNTNLSPIIISSIAFLFSIYNYYINKIEKDDETFFKLLSQLTTNHIKIFQKIDWRLIQNPLEEESDIDSFLVFMNLVAFWLCKNSRMKKYSKQFDYFFIRIKDNHEIFSYIQGNHVHMEENRKIMLRNTFESLNKHLSKY